MAGLSLAAIAEISLNLAKVEDKEPYHPKTAAEIGCFTVGFLVAFKIKEYIAMLVTSFFGAFTCTMAGSIILNKMPMKDVKHKNGKIAMSTPQLLQLWMPYIVSILVLTLIGFMYQREQLNDKQKISAQQQQLSKMMNSKPKMSMAQMERSKAKMAAAQARSSSSRVNSDASPTRQTASGGGGNNS